MEALKAEPTEFAKQMAEKINTQRAAYRKARFDEIAADLNEKLNDLIHLYFTNYVLDDDENKNNFEVLNEEWKLICQKYKRNTAINLDYHGFEKSITAQLESDVVKESIARMREDAEKVEDELEEGDAYQDSMSDIGGPVLDTIINLEAGQHEAEQADGTEIHS